MNRIAFLAFAAWLALPASSSVADIPKQFKSEVVTRSTPGHRIDIEVDIRGAKRLVLEVTDGGNGSGYDWADWIEPRLVGPESELKLTELEWEQLEGRARVNEHQGGGGPLRVDGKPVAYGIGTHANSRIVYRLPQGYELFRAQGGLDNGGTDQKGSTSSVEFRVYAGSPRTTDVSLPGFQVDVLYHAKLEEVGSWVVLAVDGKGRLVTSDRQGPLYRIEVPPIGSSEAESESVKVTKIDVPVGGANGLLEAFGSFFVVGKGSGEFKGKQGLFRLTDTTNDDTYDKVEFLIPLQVGADHHAHNVLVHPDGERLVILCGNNTDVPKTVTIRHIRRQDEDQLLPRSTYYGHNTNRLAPGGFVLICRPDGTERRVHAAGFRNPYDFAYNRDGELFTFDADMEYDVGGPWYRPTRVNHTVSGADFGWRWGAGKWPEYYVDSFGTVVDIGRGSPTGVTFGYGAKFPAKYQNAFFVADWTYGRMFAVHLAPKGATYTGEAEVFVASRGMPISDVVVRPQDGALYYVTGGRRQKTRLYRVTYVGDESTDPVAYRPPTGPEADLRRLRQTLEAFHGEENSETVLAAWPHLAHEDRAIRFAARTAIEHQPLDAWAEKALTESRPLAVIQLAVALARSGEGRYRGRLYSRLDELSFDTLEREHQLDLLRAYALAFIRLGEVSAATKEHLVATLSPRFPSGDRFLDRELCQMLLYLGAPDAVGKSVKLLLDSTTQADEMFYAYHLRTIRSGWTTAYRAAYFGWLSATEADWSDYVGGNHFRNFLKMVRREATQTLTEAERNSLRSILEKKPEVEARPAFVRPIVREWTVDDLRPALKQVEVGRSFIRGKRIAEAMCTNCHLFGGKGGALGPDLTSVGNKMDYEALLVEIVEPSRVISEQHASSVLVLQDGSVLVGREVGGDEKTILIVTDPEKPNTSIEVKRSELVSRERSDVSLMPKGAINVLREDEILDLLMYLASGGRREHTAFDR